ncbi:hypothetical protein [Pseudarthrobacter sp. PH31-O2]|uniref:hypothetical protein n=1 Tax=Pseudarthrobacter sp. PH31-O2 TaxID=3046206 RepID=UPI0024BAC4CB|nr:hypothetical protein [Pseudarthrobacter sp. PH31-O2]MDJ0354323.1 hypothetical protein [Pseudarthrobacter sp. PH31-O2]
MEFLGVPGEKIQIRADLTSARRARSRSRGLAALAAVPVVLPCSAADAEPKPRVKARMIASVVLDALRKFKRTTFP